MTDEIQDEMPMEARVVSRASVMERAYLEGTCETLMTGRDPFSTQCRDRYNELRRGAMPAQHYIDQAKRELGV